MAQSSRPPECPIGYWTRAILAATYSTVFPAPSQALMCLGPTMYYPFAQVAASSIRLNGQDMTSQRNSKRQFFDRENCFSCLFACFSALASFLHLECALAAALTPVTWRPIDLCILRRGARGCVSRSAWR